MKVALYARVSTEAQDPTPQLVKLREWVERFGHTIQLEAVDKATGKNMRRPGMESVMALVRQRHVDAVAVVKIDRWARSVKDLSNTVNEIHDRKAEFHAIDQGLSVKPNDPTAKLILNVLGAVADWEGSIISERTKDGLAGKSGRGRHWKDCGSPTHPCPTGKHKTNGVQTDQRENAQNAPTLTNDRLIEPTVQESKVFDEPSSEPGDYLSADVVGSERSEPIVAGDLIYRPPSKPEACANKNCKLYGLAVGPRGCPSCSEGGPRDCQCRPCDLRTDGRQCQNAAVGDSGFCLDCPDRSDNEAGVKRE